MDGMIRLLAASAYLAWSNTLVGNQAPAVRAVWERMSSPVEGDLVMEVTNPNREDDPVIGTLVRHYPEMSLSPGGERGVWVVRRIGAEHSESWVNARFIAIPQHWPRTDALADAMDAQPREGRLQRAEEGW